MGLGGESHGSTLITLAHFSNWENLDHGNVLKMKKR